MEHVTITRHGERFECDVLKRADLSSGKKVYCFRRLCKSPYSNNFVVAVSDGINTLEWSTFSKLNFAFTFYLDMLCCYA